MYFMYSLKPSVFVHSAVSFRKRTLRKSTILWVCGWLLTSFSWQKCNTRGKQDSAAVICKQWMESYNFGGLSPRYVTSSTPAPSITNGVCSDEALHLLESLQLSNAFSLRKSGLVNFPVSLSLDAMAIKPSLQYSSHAQGLVGILQAEIIDIT